jgi:hypothetical protein
LLSPLQITIGLALGDRPVPGQAFGRLGQGRVLAEKGASLIEPVGFLSIAGARHTTYKYVLLCHQSRGFSSCLTLLPIADGPVKLEVIFCVQAVISPLLANLFLHYAFDRWMAKQYPQLPFERFADDAIVHCRTEVEAQEVRAALAARLWDCGLELHPEKTKIVYCKDDDRRGTYPNEKFDFLGYSVLQKCTGKEVAWPN